MPTSRDDARITHTYDFITAVAYLREQYPHHKPDKLAELLNYNYYTQERGNTKITNIDVNLAICIIDRTPPTWPEGLLFYCSVYGVDVKREQFAELNARTWRLMQFLARQLRWELKRHNNVLTQIRNGLNAISRQRHFGGSVLGYWQDKLPKNQEIVIASARKLLVEGKSLKRFWESMFWFLPRDPENYALPLSFRRIEVPGEPKAAKVYIRTAKHQLCLCTRNSYIKVGV